ncbi:hypothetical protein E5D57_000362 [Metarhizium anisopliae]|nr:hypothetical protein E5D57_000362 [Metarhizium anisopliae]
MSPRDESLLHALLYMCPLRVVIMSGRYNPAPTCNTTDFGERPRTPDPGHEDMRTLRATAGQSVARGEFKVAKS